jgi:hypothetical protein
MYLLDKQMKNEVLIHRIAPVTAALLELSRGFLA